MPQVVPRLAVGQSYLMGREKPHHPVLVRRPFDRDFLPLVSGLPDFSILRIFVVTNRGPDFKTCMLSQRRH